MDKEEQDKTLSLAENVMSYWPLILIGFGGVLGGLMGGVAAVINLKIMKSERTRPAAYTLALLIGLAAIVLYLIFAIIISTLFFSKTVN